MALQFLRSWGHNKEHVKQIIYNTPIIVFIFFFFFFFFYFGHNIYYLYIFLVYSVSVILTEIYIKFRIEMAVWSEELSSLLMVIISK